MAKKQGSNDPGELSEGDFGSAPYDPGYSLDESLQEATVDDLKRGYQEGG